MDSKIFPLLFMLFVIYCSNTPQSKSDIEQNIIKDVYNDGIVESVSDILFDSDLIDIEYDIESDIADRVVETPDSYEISEDFFDAFDIDLDISDVPSLTPELIGFESPKMPKKGSIIFYNNWSMIGGKDSIEAISPDGSYREVLIYVNRVWSFGVGKNGNLLVFSTNDPYQLERYGLNINDAIQNTWLFDWKSPPIQISFGPVNDECHTFISDEQLMMCRRANFRPDPQYYVVSDPYRILIYNLKSGQEDFITPFDVRYNDYYGAIRSDGVILFNRNIIANRTIDIMSLEPKTKEINLILKDANSPVLSPDGNEVLFKKKGQNKIFLSSAFDLNNAIVIIDAGSRLVGRYVFSPDGSKIAYTLDDRANNCYDLFVSDKNGENPQKILDCSDDKKFITVVNWIEVR